MSESLENNYNPQEDINPEKGPEVVQEVSPDDNNQPTEVQSNFEKSEQLGTEEEVAELVSKLYEEEPERVEAVTDQSKDEEPEPVKTDLTDQPEDEETKVPGKLLKITNNKKYKIEEREIDIDGTKFVYKIYIRKKDGVVDNCKVMDSYKIDEPETIRKFIDEIFDKYPSLLSKRDKDSYCQEWLAHNFLYKLHILRIATRDVDMDIYSIKMLQKAYNIMGKWNLSMQKRNKSKNDLQN